MNRRTPVKPLLRLYLHLCAIVICMYRNEYSHIEKAAVAANIYNPLRDVLRNDSALLMHLVYKQWTERRTTTPSFSIDYRQDSDGKVEAYRCVGGIQNVGMEIAEG